MSLFSTSNPEVQKQIKIINLENKIKENASNLYKNGYLQGEFAQSFYLLEQHTKALLPYLSNISETADKNNKERLYSILIETGFNDDAYKNSKLLPYEQRKQRMKEASKSIVELEYQRHNLENCIAVLKTKPFLQIQQTLQNFDIFLNLCTFNYINCIHLFDPSYQINQQSQPSFEPVQIEKAETVLQDFFYVSKNLKINASLVRIIFAIITISHTMDISESTKSEITKHVKNIAAVFSQILNPEKLTNLLKLSKKDPNFIPQAMESQENYLLSYIEKLKRKFNDEEKRISSELQDEKLTSIIQKLFKNRQMTPLIGYNQTLNTFLQENSSFSFLWITPLEIVKNFLDTYFTEEISALFNDIVLEGFFINPTYKTTFSALVYSCTESLPKIQQFEESFGMNAKNSTSLIQGYVRDIQKDTNFEKSLETLVDSINEEAKDLVQRTSNTIAQMYVNIDNILNDARKTSSEEIENIKVLLQSSRNHDRIEFLEQSLPKWQMFVNIMKNYAIIKDDK